jgi:hypothetical protein
MKVAKSKGIPISEYTLFADEANQNHRWYIGSELEIDPIELAHEIDQELSLINDDYAYVRKYNLGTPSFQIIPTSLFYGFLESLGKLGAQNKMPRVLNPEQAKKWLSFLSANGYH